MQRDESPARHSRAAARRHSLLAAAPFLTLLRVPSCLISSCLAPLSPPLRQTHQQLVDQYRKLVFTPFFGKQARAAKLAFNATAFDASLSKFLGDQLTATLTNLSPPKSIQWYGVSITAAPAGRG